MRLFAALALPESVVAELRRVVEPLWAAGGDLRWSRPESWHLTLTFLGETPEERLPELSERLGRAARRGTPLSLALGHGGRFGSRVLWVGVDGEREPLKRLATATAAAARRSGLTVQDRQFRPHLTLARCRERAGADLRAYVDALAGFSGTPWLATDLHLVRSHLGGQVRYERVASWALGEATAARLPAGD